ncbi:hypothetical protein PQR39_41410 [Paraburkholderia sediminicola]|uniref:hypothetical protein n=1 Tax=Paraburkholderia sediminicola TaxID=458836 RepID=UPI0038BDC688
MTSRDTLAEKAQRYYLAEQLATFLTIGLGLVTTVLVALSSTDFIKRETTWGASIRIGAIAFPAIGTAAAAVIAFYNPSANFSRASHSLLGLKQLHEQITTVLWKSEGLDCRYVIAIYEKSNAAKSPAAAVKQQGLNATDLDPKWQDLSNRVDAWEQRYRDILDASTPDGAAQQAGPSPASGASADSGQNPASNTSTMTAPPKAKRAGS